MLTEHDGGPLGVAQAATLLILKPLSSQTAISLAQNEAETSSALNAIAESEDLVRKKYLCPPLQRDEESPPGVCCQARVLRGRSVPGSGPRHGLIPAAARISGAVRSRLLCGREAHALNAAES